mgnify:CR=1 FL=1
MNSKLKSLLIYIGNSIRINFDKSYIASLEEAYNFTARKFGHKIKLSDVHFPIGQYTLDDFKKVVPFIADYVKRQGEFNIALRCNIVCMDIHDKLKSKYNIDSIVTSGDFWLSGRKIWSTTGTQLTTQFEHTIPTMSHHVWLTVGEYIIDPTIMMTIRQRIPNLFSDAVYDETHMIFLCKYSGRAMYINNILFEYKPRLVGQEFYKYTHYGIPVFSILSDYRQVIRNEREEEI